MRLMICLLFFSYTLLGQSVDEPVVKNTSLGLVLGPNITFSSVDKSFSIGGTWGIHLDHLFEDSDFGFTVGINYALVHVGENQGRLAPASEAFEFRMLETSVNLLYIPFQEFRNIRLKPGIVHGLVSGNYTTPILSDYNIIMLNFGIEYKIPNKSDLSTTLAWDYRYYSLDKERFGNHITSVFTLKLGVFK